MALHSLSLVLQRFRFFRISPANNILQGRQGRSFWERRRREVKRERRETTKRNRYNGFNARDCFLWSNLNERPRRFVHGRAGLSTPSRHFPALSRGCVTLAGCHTTSPAQSLNHASFRNRSCDPSHQRSSSSSPAPVRKLHPSYHFFHRIKTHRS